MTRRATHLTQASIVMLPLQLQMSCDNKFAQLNKIEKNCLQPSPEVTKIVIKRVSS